MKSEESTSVLRKVSTAPSLPRSIPLSQSLTSTWEPFTTPERKEQPRSVFDGVHRYTNHPASSTVGHSLPKRVARNSRRADDGAGPGADSPNSALPADGCPPLSGPHLTARHSPQRRTLKTLQGRGCCRATR